MPLEEEEIRKELKNAKDPFECWVVLMARQNEETIKWRDEVKKALKSLDEKIEPISRVYLSASYWKRIGGWLIAFCIGLILGWEYLIKIIKTAITRI